jgi:hypothetical protein
VSTVRGFETWQKTDTETKPSQFVDGRLGSYRSETGQQNQLGEPIRPNSDHSEGDVGMRLRRDLWL